MHKSSVLGLILTTLHIEDCQLASALYCLYFWFDLLSSPLSSLLLDALVDFWSCLCVLEQSMSYWGDFSPVSAKQSVLLVKVIKIFPIKVWERRELLLDVKPKQIYFLFDDPIPLLTYLRKVFLGRRDLLNQIHLSSQEFELVRSWIVKGLFLTNQFFQEADHF